MSSDQNKSSEPQIPVKKQQPEEHPYPYGKPAKRSDLNKKYRPTSAKSSLQIPVKRQQPEEPPTPVKKPIKLKKHYYKNQEPSFPILSSLFRDYENKNSDGNSLFADLLPRIPDPDNAIFPQPPPQTQDKKAEPQTQDKKAEPQTQTFFTQPQTLHNKTQNLDPLVSQKKQQKNALNNQIQTKGTFRPPMVSKSLFDTKQEQNIPPPKQKPQVEAREEPIDVEVEPPPKQKPQVEDREEPFELSPQLDHQEEEQEENQTDQYFKPKKPPEPIRYIHNFIYQYQNYFNIDNDVEYLEEAIHYLYHDSKIKKIYDEFANKNYRKKLIYFIPDETSHYLNIEEQLKRKINNNNSNIYILLNELYGFLKNYVYNPTDKIWPYFMSSEMNEPFNEYGLLNIVSFDPNIIKLTYEKFTFDELLSSVINLKLRRPENTDYPDINRLKEDIYYVSALIYTSCIEFIEFYIKNELKYLEDNELYNYVDFLFTYNNDNTDKYTYKNFDYEYDSDQNINNFLIMNNNIIFINMHVSKINNLIQIIDLLHLRCQHALFSFINNNMNVIFDHIKKYDHSVKDIMKQSKSAEFVLELIYDYNLILGPLTLFYFIPSKYNDIGVKDYGFVDFINKALKWKKEFYSQTIKKIAPIFNIIQNSKRSVLLNDKNLFDEGIKILDDYKINEPDIFEFYENLENMKTERIVLDYITELNISNLISFKNKFDSNLSEMNSFDKFFTFIKENSNFNNQIYLDKIEFQKLRQQEFNKNYDDIRPLQINENDNKTNKIKNFVFTLITILTNKLSNTKTAENNKNLICDEFKYYLIKLYKLNNNLTKYEEKENENITYGKEKIKKFNEKINDIIVAYNKEINPSNTNLINAIADFLIPILNFDDEVDYSGVSDLFKGGAKINKIKKNISDVLILALNEKGTVYWIDNDYYKLMPDEEEIYKEYLNALKEQNAEYREIFDRVNNDAQIDPEEMNNIIKKNDKINELTRKIKNLKKKLEDILKKEDRKKKKIEDKKIKKKSFNDTKIRIDNNIVSLILILQELSNTDNYSSQNPKVQALLNNVISGIQNYHSSDKKNNIQSNSIIKTLEDNFINHFKSNRIGKSLNNNEMRMVDFTAQINNSLESLIKENKVKNGDKFIVSRTNSIKDGEIYVLMDHDKNESDNLIVLLTGKNPKNGNIEKFKVNLAEDEYFKNNCDYAHLVLEETQRSGKNGADVLSAKYKYFNPNYNRFNF